MVDLGRILFDNFHDCSYIPALNLSVFVGWRNLELDFTKKKAILLAGTVHADLLGFEPSTSSLEVDAK